MKELSKVEMKKELKKHGFLMAEMLHQCNMALMSEQDYKGNGKVHTRRVYGSFDQAQESIKNQKNSNKKKIANAIFEILKDTRKAMSLENCQYFTLVSSQNGIQIGFKIERPQALKSFEHAQASVENSIHEVEIMELELMDLETINIVEILHQEGEDKLQSVLSGCNDEGLKKILSKEGVKKNLKSRQEIIEALLQIANERLNQGKAFTKAA